MKRVANKRKEMEMAEQNKTRTCCPSDCCYLEDDGKSCYQGRNPCVEEKENCERCEGFSTRISRIWGTCSKGLYIECDYYCSNEYEDDDEEEDDHDWGEQ